MQSLQEPIADLPPLAIAPPDEDPSPALASSVGSPSSLVAARAPGGERSASPAPAAPAGPGCDAGSDRRDDRITIDFSGLDALFRASGDSPVATTPDPAASTLGNQPSVLESFYAGELPARPDRAVRQYGYDVFAARGPELMARSAGPVDRAHVVAVGDELVVTIESESIDQHVLTVLADETVLIPELVAVPVAGLRLDAAETAVRDAVAVLRRDPVVRLSVRRVGGIVVRVVGEASRPGLIALPARATMIDALSAAGIRTSGSLRTIRLERTIADGTRTATAIDLYDYLIGSPAASDPRLTQGDVVVIPPIGRTIAVAGSVQRPAINELPGDPAGPLTVGTALRLAGGTTAFTVSGQMQVERTVDGARRLIDLVDDPGASLLDDGDLLLVGAVDGRLQPVVEVRGEVARPGRFQHRPGMTIGDLVRLAGGPTVRAYGRQALLSRQVGATAARDVLIAGPSERTARRVLVIDLELALTGAAEHDVALMPLDLLEVIRPEDAHDIPTVEVIGAVRRPGVYELTAGLRVGDLIALAGNLEPDAHRSEAELVRRVVDDHGSLDVRRFRLDLGRALAHRASDPTLRTGDRLIVRRMSRAEVRVVVSGRVRFPGEYVLPAGTRVVEMLEAAGGLLPDADLRGAVFSRESVRRLQQDRWEDLIERTRQSLERNLEQRVNGARTKEAVSARLQLEQSREMLGRLRAAQTTGRIVLPLTDPGFPDAPDNLVLEPGDRIDVPRRRSTVTIAGHVFNPITVVHREGLSANELLRLSGGFTEFGDQDRLYVIRVDGTVASVQQSHGRFDPGAPLGPGDVVLAPRQPLKRDFGSVLLDTLLIARAAAEAGMLTRGAIDGVGESNLTIVDSPASPRPEGVPAEFLRSIDG